MYYSHDASRGALREDAKELYRDHSEAAPSAESINTVGAREAGIVIRISALHATFVGGPETIGCRRISPP
jgi:hypothetical protein